VWRSGCFSSSSTCLSKGLKKPARHKVVWAACFPAGCVQLARIVESLSLSRTAAPQPHPPVHTPPWQERPPLQAVPLALGGGELHCPVARLHVLRPSLHSLRGAQVTPTHISEWGRRVRPSGWRIPKKRVCLSTRLSEHRIWAPATKWFIHPAFLSVLRPPLQTQPHNSALRTPTCADAALAGAAPAAGRAVGLGRPRAARPGCGVARACGAFALQPRADDADTRACGGRCAAVRLGGLLGHLGPCWVW
jgi:hypothetical protein